MQRGSEEEVEGDVEDEEFIDEVILYVLQFNLFQLISQVKMCFHLSGVFRRRRR